MAELRIHSILAFIVAVASLSCGTRKEETPPRPAVVVAIEGDIDSFSPLFAEDVVAGEINDLLFPSLVGSEFDRSSGALRYTPLLARAWEYGNQDRDITFHLIGNARWSDQSPVTARDVQLSYELYGDPDVGSIRQAAVENLVLTKGKPDIARSVEVVNDSTVVFHFARAYPGQLFDAGLPILPAHIFEKPPRKDLRTHGTNKSPLGCGPFSLEKWTPLQEVILESNLHSVVPYPARLARLVFRIIPEYRSRLSQLESGEVDVVSGLRPEDADRLEKDSPAVEIVTTPGRDYDFLGWNNIDPKTFSDSKGRTIKPHRLFGSSLVRRALTLSVNRVELVEAYLGRHGMVASGGISPLFKWAYNDSLKPLPFDPQLAKALLTKDGWKDADGDGVLDKNGVRFSFALKVPAGNQLRNVVATAVQQQLRNLQIEMMIEQVERGTFWEDVTARKYDAWLAGFSVPLQMQLDDLWGSDLAKYPFNLTGFRNNRVDAILAATKNLKSEIDGADLWKEFQRIVHDEQPCTFLYWINNIVAVNRRVGSTRVGVLGTTHRAWEWHVEQSGSIATAHPR